jgi:hypothetical protein
MRIILLFLVLALSGCSSLCGPATVVKVPVVQPWPEPPPAVRPVLASESLDSENFGYDDLNRTLRVTVEQLKAYARELENYLNVYRHPPTTQPKE